MLKLNNIYKSFNRGTVNENNVFEDFSFSVGEGDFVSIIGSNGSGKSTLLNLISGSLKADSGTITLKDEDITNANEHKRAKHLMRVYQDPSMSGSPSLTLLENMALFDNKGRSFTVRQAIKKNKREEYGEILKLLEMGLENRLDNAVSSLSGGERQGLMLALCKISKSKILLLDEHTAALDPKASETIMRLTNKLIEENNLTAIMVTHNLKHALGFGNRLVMLHKGEYVYNHDNANGRLELQEVLDKFYEISIEVGNSV